MINFSISPIQVRYQLNDILIEALLEMTVRQREMLKVAIQRDDPLLIGQKWYEPCTILHSVSDTDPITGIFPLFYPFLIDLQEVFRTGTQIRAKLEQFVRDITKRNADNFVIFSEWLKETQREEVMNTILLAITTAERISLKTDDLFLELLYFYGFRLSKAQSNSDIFMDHWTLTDQFLLQLRAGKCLIIDQVSELRSYVELDLLSDWHGELASNFREVVSLGPIPADPLLISICSRLFEFFKKSSNMILDSGMAYQMSAGCRNYPIMWWSLGSGQLMFTREVSTSHMPDDPCIFNLGDPDSLEQLDRWLELVLETPHLLLV